MRPTTRRCYQSKLEIRSCPLLQLENSFSFDNTVVHLCDVPKRFFSMLNVTAQIFETRCRNWKFSTRSNGKRSCIVVIYGHVSRFEFFRSTVSQPAMLKSDVDLSTHLFILSSCQNCILKAKFQQGSRQV